MLRIDCDAHVDETDETWEFLEEKEKRFRPITINQNMPIQAWQSDGVEFRRPFRNHERTGVSVESSQLLDVNARLSHLKTLRIDNQVLFPTTFLRSNFVGHEALERALTRSYNRWISKRTSQTDGRLQWVAVLPLLSMQEAIDELRWASQHGACGVFKKGVECGGKDVSDPYFFPLYEAACELDLPICIHTGSEGSDQIQTPTAWDAVRAFFPLVTSDVFTTFPTLRVGIIEAGASWVPFLLTLLAAKTRSGHFQSRTLDFEIEVDRDLFKRLNIFVACQSQDDVGYLIQYGLEENLIVGTDYTHADQSAELRSLDRIESLAETGVISRATVDKVLDQNARCFYKFSDR